MRFGQVLGSTRYAAHCAIAVLLTASLFQHSAAVDAPPNATASFTRTVPAFADALQSVTAEATETGDVAPAPTPANVVTPLPTPTPATLAPPTPKPAPWDHTQPPPTGEYPACTMIEISGHYIYTFWMPNGVSHVINSFSASDKRECVHHCCLTQGCATLAYESRTRTCTMSRATRCEAGDFFVSDWAMTHLEIVGCSSPAPGTAAPISTPRPGSWTPSPVTPIPPMWANAVRLAMNVAEAEFSQYHIDEIHVVLGRIAREKSGTFTTHIVQVTFPSDGKRTEVIAVIRNHPRDSDAFIDSDATNRVVSKGYTYWNVHSARFDVALSFCGDATFPKEPDECAQCIPDTLSVSGGWYYFAIAFVVALIIVLVTSCVLNIQGEISDKARNIVFLVARVLSVVWFYVTICRGVHVTLNNDVIICGTERHWDCRARSDILWMTSFHAWIVTNLMLCIAFVAGVEKFRYHYFEDLKKRVTLPTKWDRVKLALKRLGMTLLTGLVPLIFSTALSPMELIPLNDTCVVMGDTLVAHRKFVSAQVAFFFLMFPAAAIDFCRVQYEITKYYSTGVIFTGFAVTGITYFFYELGQRLVEFELMAFSVGVPALVAVASVASPVLVEFVAGAVCAVMYGQKLNKKWYDPVVRRLTDELDDLTLQEQYLPESKPELRTCLGALKHLEKCNVLHGPTKKYPKIPCRLNVARLVPSVEKAFYHHDKYREELEFVEEYNIPKQNVLAILFYTHEADGNTSCNLFSTLNAALRTYRTEEQYEKAWVKKYRPALFPFLKLLVDGLLQCPAFPNVTLFRGVNNVLTVESYEAQVLSGTVWCSQFGSSSSQFKEALGFATGFKSEMENDKSAATENVLAEAKMDIKNTSVIEVLSTCSAHRVPSLLNHEMESILLPDTPFRVTSWDKSTVPVRIYLEEIPLEEALAEAATKHGPQSPAATVAIAQGQREEEEALSSEGGDYPIVPVVVAAPVSDVPRYWTSNDSSPMTKVRVTDRLMLANLQLLMSKSCIQHCLGQGKDQKTKVDDYNGLHVIEAFRIENRELWTRYNAEHRIREERQKHNPNSIPQRIQSQNYLEWMDDPSCGPELNGMINELYLWHGTDKIATVDSIARHGFDSTRAREGMYGQGIYFAENSSKSDQYGAPDPPVSAAAAQALEGQYHMILSRVIMCDFYFADHPRSGPRPPLRTETQFFDSVVGHFVPKGVPFRYREFVVYHGHLTYPEYHIVYKRVKNY